VGRWRDTGGGVAAWYFLAGFVFLFIGVETRGRTIEEFNAALVGPALEKIAAPQRH
jgi:hypothetical protein